MPPDRRVERTQQALRGALFELILERGFDAVTVSDITARANVGRSTFYAHFADKEDLLQSGAEGLGSFLRAEIDARQADGARAVHPALAFCLPMLEHAFQQRQLFAAMAGKRAGHFFQELVHDLWAELIRASWPEGDEITVQAIAGGFGSVVLWWFSQAPELSAEEVDARFRAGFEGQI